MSIEGAVAAKEAEVQAGKTCKVARFVDVMPGEERMAALYAVDLCRKDPENYPAAWLHNVLNVNGYTVGKTAVNDHLNGRCTCDHSQ